MRRAVSRDLFDDANEAIHQSKERISYSGNTFITMVMDRIRQVVAEKWPQKTAYSLTAKADLKSLTQAYRVLNGEQGFSGPVLIRLLRTEHGFDVLEAIMKGCTEEWWLEAGVERRRTQIRQKRRLLDREERQLDVDTP